MSTRISDMTIARELLAIADGKHGQLVHLFVVDPEESKRFSWWCDGLKIEIGPIPCVDFNLSLNDFSIRHLAPAVKRMRAGDATFADAQNLPMDACFWTEVRHA